MKFDQYNSYSEEILLDIQEYLEKRQFDHYDSTSGLCHPVLSKNPYSSRFLDYYLKDQALKFPFLLLLTNSLLFIIKFLKGFLYESLMILLSPKSSPDQASLKLIVISFFNYDKKAQSLRDELYFPGLQRELDQKNIPFVHFPKLYNTPRNVFKALKELKQIKQENPHYISPYELIKRRDIFALFCLSVGHYFQNLKTLRLFSNQKMDQFFNQSMVETISISQVYMFMCFLASKRIAQIAKDSKVILWYENQIVDKCVIRGLRTNPELKIYGAQFFLIVPQEMNLFPSKYELKTGLCPDIILTNQAHNIFVQDPSRYRQGISMRYLYMEKHPLPIAQTSPANHIALFLTSFEARNQAIYKTLINAKLGDYIFNVRKHPGLMKTKIPDEKNWIHSEKNQVELLTSNDLVISADSGIIFEAMAMGKQVIILGSHDAPSFYIPPSQFQDKLWAHVTNEKEMSEKIGILRAYRQEHLSELNQLAAKARKDYFSNSPQSILEIFDIK